MHDDLWHNHTYLGSNHTYWRTFIWAVQCDIYHSRTHLSLIIIFGEILIWVIQCEIYRNHTYLGIIILTWTIWRDTRISNTHLGRPMWIWAWSSSLWQFWFVALCLLQTSFNVIVYKDRPRLRTAVELLRTTQEIEGKLEEVLTCYFLGTSWTLTLLKKKYLFKTF